MKILYEDLMLLYVFILLHCPFGPVLIGHPVARVWLINPRSSVGYSQIILYMHRLTVRYRIVWIVWIVCSFSSGFMGSAGPLTHKKQTCSWTVSWVNVIQSMHSHCASVRSFLGAFAKLRKATVRFGMSVCPSAWNSSAPIGRIFMKFDTWTYFRNLSRNVQFH